MAVTVAPVVMGTAAYYTVSGCNILITCLLLVAWGTHMTTTESTDLTAFLNAKRGKGLKASSIQNYRAKLKQFEAWRAQLGKPYQELDQGDLSAYLVYLEDEVKQVASTRQLSLTAVKQFMRWILSGGKKNGHLRGPMPDCVAYLEVKDDHSQKPDVHVTPDLLDHILAEQPTLARKVLFAMLYDTGARQGELRKVKLRDVGRDEYAQYVQLKGKTGHRRVWLHESLALLLPYLNSLPADPDAWLFPAPEDMSRPLSTKQVARYMRLAVKRMKKRGTLNESDRLRPHSLRHTKARNLKNKGWSEDRLCGWMGWSLKSNMAARYGAARPEDIADAFLRDTGQKSKDETVEFLECPACNTKSGATCKFCPSCGYALRPEFAADSKEAQKSLELQAELHQARGLLQKLREFPELSEVLGI